ncbi:hypothetical protein ACIBCN_17305 [Nocardia sp. NPDC051052]|uniref:hypothetical protein n=1 Tax=Nocardia sp. NPDC051052 TaxID=3364322 RepID=UPI00379C8F5F
MTEIAIRFHSPLTLLRQWGARPDGARLREALVMGYTLDLVFFEQRFLPAARGLGARVTVLSDANQAVHEPVDVRKAGRSYQHGNVGCTGAFHPKLAVFIGDDDIWIAIGSGNPTTSGWGHNAELWLVARSASRARPAAFGDLAGWLTQLPDVVFMPKWIADTITELAALITPAEIDQSVAQLRILGNINRPIVERLPTGPVSSLGLSAPFFDPAADAVRALVARLEPDEITIALQEKLSQFCGESLVAATSSVDHVEFQFIDDQRTYHGKLVEWTGDAGRTAMVGSANLSRSALLLSTREAGNCELVALFPTPESLVPEGDTVGPDQIRRRSTVPAERTRRQPVPLTILGARRLADGIEVELVARRGGAITIETSPTGAPATWLPRHVVDVDTTGPISASFPALDTAGAAVRAWLDDGSARHLSSVVFVTDIARCQPNSIDPSAPRLIRDYNLEEVFIDPQLAARFNADLARLMSTISEYRATAPALTGAAKATETLRDSDRWGAWLEETERVLGPSLAGLVFPGSVSPAQADTAQWTVDAQAPLDIADDENEEDVDPIADGVSVSGGRGAMVIDTTQRQSWRKWAAKLRGRVTTTRPRPPLELRMVVTLLHLDLLAAGVWGPDDEWRAEFADIVKALPPSETELDSIPGRAIDAMCSLLAVSLALLFQDARLHGGTADDLLLRSVWNEVGEWAAYAEDELVAGYLISAKQGYSRVATESGVAAVIALAQESADGPEAEIRAALDEEGIAAEHHDGAWFATVDGQLLRRVAARIATLAGDPCVAVASNTSGFCVVIQSGRTLAFGESRAKRWRVFEMSAIGTPLSVLANADGFPPTKAQFPLDPPAAPIAALADAAGVNLAQLLAVLRSAG